MWFPSDKHTRNNAIHAPLIQNFYFSYFAFREHDNVTQTESNMYQRLTAQVSLMSKSKEVAHIKTQTFVTYKL